MSPTPPEAPDAFALHALLDGCDAEVSLNDVPLAGAHLRRAQASVHATPWIVDGENELRIEVRAMRHLAIFPMGAAARDPEVGAVAASARVIAGFYEDLVPDPERDMILCELAWGPVDDAGRSLPATRSGTFTVNHRPRWAWQDAALLDPEAPRDRARVLAFVRTIHSAFAAGDVAAVIARMPSLVRESAHFGPQSANFSAGFAAELARVASEPDHALAPFEDDVVVLRPIAGGRVLRVLHASGGALVRSALTAREGFRFRLDLVLIGGELEIARIG